jgi:hypothetical protein
MLPALHSGLAFEPLLKSVKKSLKNVVSSLLMAFQISSSLLLPDIPFSPPCHELNLFLSQN